MVQPESLRHSEHLRSRVSVKGQTVIPAELRRMLNITPGTSLRWEVRGHLLCAHPISQDPLGASRGLLSGSGLTLPDFLEARRQGRR